MYITDSALTSGTGDAGDAVTADVDKTKFFTQFLLMIRLE